MLFELLEDSPSLADDPGEEAEAELSESESEELVNAAALDSLEVTNSDEEDVAVDSWLELPLPA